jgi:hypothetical protein
MIDVEIIGIIHVFIVFIVFIASEKPQPLSERLNSVSSSGISLYIYPIGQPSTIILSLAKQPAGASQPVKRGWIPVLKNFFVILGLPLGWVEKQNE